MMAQVPLRGWAERLTAAISGTDRLREPGNDLGRPVAKRKMATRVGLGKRHMMYIGNSRHQDCREWKTLRKQ